MQILFLLGPLNQDFGSGQIRCYQNLGLTLVEYLDIDKTKAFKSENSLH